MDYAENEEVAGKVALYGITDPSTVAPSLKQGTYDYVVAPQPGGSQRMQKRRGRKREKRP